MTFFNDWVILSGDTPRYANFEASRPGVASVSLRAASLVDLNAQIAAYEAPFIAAAAGADQAKAADELACVASGAGPWTWAEQHGR